MSLYQYVASDAHGNLHRDSIELDSLSLLRQELSLRGLRLLSYAMSEPTGSRQRGQTRGEYLELRGIGSIVNNWLRTWMEKIPPSSVKIEATLEQLALMLKNHVGMLEALEVIGEQCRSGAIRNALKRMSHRIQEGSSVEAATVNEKLFPAFIPPLIAVGEKTGNLDLVLMRAAKQISQRRKNRNALVGAFAYPAFVLTAALAVAIYLLVMVIPQLQKLLSGLGKKLPAMTQSLVDLGNAFQEYAFPISVSVFALACAALFVYRTERGRLACDRAFLRLPWIGSLLQYSATHTFASFLAIMNRSGMTLIDSLATIATLHGNRHIARGVERAREMVLCGRSLSESLSQQEIFAPMLPSMIAVSEKTGDMEEIMDRVSTFYDEQLTEKIRRWNAVIEPAIIIVVGVVVGYVYMAFFVALFSVGGKFR